MVKRTQTAAERPAATLQTLPALFAACAARDGAAPAVRYGATHWTYGELAERVNRLSRWLSSRGVTRGSVVPLLFRVSPEAVQSMLAVLQSGAAYVALDAGHPPARLRAVLDDMDVPLLLGSADVVDGVLGGWSGGEVVRIDDLDLDGFSAETPDTGPSPEDLAYVLYTSGSTGTPKGVEVPHGALSNYLQWSITHYPIATGGGSLVHTSLAVDLTVTSVFAPLLLGQPVSLLPVCGDELGAVARAVADAQHPFSFLKMTPSHLRGLRKLVSPDTLARATRCLILGGEQLLAEDLAGFETYVTADFRIFNEYGPTETAVGSTCYEVSQVPASGPIPIGTSIANTEVFICDEQLRPVPAGSTGELCIAGAGLARGYHKRPDLTARSFVTLPGTSHRVYRTGDSVRQDADSVLTFIGRLDQQAKVRGHRVELDEVELTLRSHPAVSEALVVVDGAGESARLVAFVVPDVSRRESHADGALLVRHATSPAELHRHAAERLPEYMCPSLFVFLDAVPRTTGGKVDRAALLRRVGDGLHARAEYVTPRNDLEAALAATWMKVLKLDAVGIDDNYFALGGDSIRSIQLAGEAQLRGLTLSVGHVHQFPTIRTLAAALTAKDGDLVSMPQTRPFDLISAEDRALMPTDVEDAYPLNLLQEGMIYHRAFAAKSAVYHAMLSLRLRAPYDGDVLRQSVQELVNRHPLMRTSFDQRTFSIPLQLVHRTFEDPLQAVDLRGLSPEQQEAPLAAWFEEEKKRGFNIDEFPLIRFMVHRLADDVFQLSFSYHHEIIDGWSEATMVSELLTRYLSIMAGEPVDIPVPTSTFRDSVRLEQMALASDTFRSFWQNALSGATLMRLPRLLSSPKADKGQREIVKIRTVFPNELSEGLKRLALTLGVPLKSVLLAGHMKVMGLFGGSDDVVTHTVSNGRPETPDGASLVGLFVNSFTFRQKLAHSSWRDLILNTLRLEQASIPYRRYPMAELKRHQGHDPLSETLFFLIDYHVYHRLERWTNATLLRHDVYGESTFPFCATFRVNHANSDLDMQIEYDRLQFPAELVDAIAATYFSVFDAMRAAPSGKHHLFGSLPEPAAASVPPHALTAAATCHQWFEEQVARTPDAAAVVCGRDTLSFASLNARANRLARWLRAQGVGPERRVGLLLDRSTDLVGAMLGVLKAGACYVPLDPEHRSDRTQTIVSEAEPSLVLTTERLRAILGEGVDPVKVRVSCLEDVWPAARDLPSGDLMIPMEPENLAYIIFTSGSTGTPKGVMIEHRSLVNSTAARLREYPGLPERFLLLSSHAFDSSVAGLYWTLCSGCTLVLPSAPGVIDLNAALSTARREEVTHLLCIPSFYSSMLESANPGDLASLRVATVAGEECRTELWEQHKRLAPGVEFFNEYGPTEATVWSTVWKGDPSVPRASLPIGRNIANVTTAVLDQDQQHTPTGVAGELYVGGVNVARGYTRNPAATAERFVPDPGATAHGDRLYRTGDLVRLTLNGDIEYLGRRDHQVKVRGFRIEPGEIEAVLESHPAVKRAVVVPQEDRAGEKQLVAYVIPAVDSEVTASDLLTLSKERLPKYLIPSSFVVVKALPLTATGKVDRNALPALSTSEASEAVRVAPRTPTEEAIAGIWSKVLGVERVGVTSDFFALGGESLRAMRILSQIRKAFDVELPIASLVNSQATVAGLADAVDSVLWLRANAAETPVGPPPLHGAAV